MRADYFLMATVIFRGSGALSSARRGDGFGFSAAGLIAYGSGTSGLSHPVMCTGADASSANLHSSQTWYAQYQQTDGWPGMF